MEKILPERLELMRKSITDRNFDQVAEITMRDSNNFHSVCRDTFPTINYLNETSEFLIRCVDNLNNFFTQKMKLNRKFVVKKYYFTIIKLFSVLILLTQVQIALFSI